MLIVGAGVIGCAVARELSRYQLDVLVVERAHDVGEGSSKANSGIVQAGFHARGGSMKGTSCVAGNRMLRQLARELDIPLVESGGLMVAFDDEGIEKLREKMTRGIESGACGLEIISGEEARALEPRLSPYVVAAMKAPSTAIISPFDLVLALAENAHDNGVQFWFDACVASVTASAETGGKNSWQVQLEDGRAVLARFVVNAAGDQAALLDAQVTGDTYEVAPRRGEFLVFDKQDPANAITHVLYQAAQSDEGGTLLAPTVDGNLLAGPTSVDAAGFDDVSSTREGLNHVARVAKKLIPDLDMSKVIRNFAGVRANIVNVPKELKDFVVRESAPHFVSALGIKNPGLTSSPALALQAISFLEAGGLPLVKRTGFIANRRAYTPFLRAPEEEQQIRLASDKAHARVVCRCEGITAGDVVAVLKRPLAPRSLSGVKRRLRCSMGRCQGQFCEPRVNDVLAAEFGVSASKILGCEHRGRLVAGCLK